MDPHQLTIAEVLSELRSSPRGLSSDEARLRLGTHGPNQLIEKKKKTPLQLFLDQFKDFMILVLIAAAVVSGIIGEPADTIAIIVIVLLNAVLGFTQEYRAEKAMEALKRMAASLALVVREGEHRSIPASELVPGDIVVIEAGVIVPADMRVIDAARLRIEEAALTGESEPVEKTADVLAGEASHLGDRRNMLYKGTIATNGRGIGVVTATGMNTELGRIAAMIQTGEGRTPLQKRLAHFGQRISIVILIICALIFAMGLLRGEPAVNIFLVAVSLAVAAIPEALPAVVTIALALGARRMVKQNALIRNLPAVETLGSVTYICTDKTGTLTLNRMTVEEVWVDGVVLSGHGDTVTGRLEETADAEKPDRTSPRLPLAASPRLLFFTALALSNDARVSATGETLGDPTETALFAAAQSRGFNKPDLETARPRIAELPFDAERKLMTTFHTIPRDTQGVVLPVAASPRPRVQSFTKGAVEILIERSESVLTSDGVKPIDRAELERVSTTMAADGLRVMAIGMRTWDRVPPDLSPEIAENGLVLLGLIGMMDPPRDEARDAVSLCRTAGIIPVMITGDHPLTASVIAKRVGILANDDPTAIITGSELAALPLETFEHRVEHIRVYARVAPEQKLTIVRALQDRGHFVAMTGDGVNDAPALKRADIGVAMGITGTDVAKEASSMILLDDNFATIVKAVREGRKIYDNIRKVIKYLLSSNSGEIWTLSLAPLFGLPVPLQPIHILWINLVTDGLPALALSLEPAEQDVMRRPPRHPQENLFSRGLGAYTIWVGLLMALVTLAAQAWAIHIGDSHWQTMVFTVLCFLELGNVMAIRSEQESLFTQGIFTNKTLLATVAATVALQIATIYVPVLNPVFKTAPLSTGELALVCALSSIVFVAVELAKFVKRSRKTA